MRSYLLTALLAVILGSTSRAAEAEDVYTEQIRPLLAAHCIRCHGGDKARAELDLSHPQGLRQGSYSGSILDATKSGASLLWQQVAEDAMPPGRKKLPADAKAVLKKWLEQGAPMPQSAKKVERRAGGFFPPSPKRLTPGQLDALFGQAIGQPLREQFRSTPATYLRRISLDLIGRQPTPQERAAFLAQPASTRRVSAIERLLASPEFGQNWANYWTDVIRFRVPPPELTFLLYDDFRAWLAEQINQDTPWDVITRKLLTASGKVADQPATTFVAFHQANPKTLAAETARIFLGVQIQCAQCHDHKFDHWRREQFHQLAAFFGRTKAKLTQKRAGGTVVKDAGKGEYRMPNLEDPRKKGEVMTPTFLTGATLPLGTPDAKRRAFLAEQFTAAENPWFAAAYVNRIWARLLGRGFYEPVDNLADYQEHLLPEVHQALTNHFAATGHDIKDLFRLILQSEAYQRALTREQHVASAGPYAKAQTVRLRGDEVFQSLERALGLPNVTPSEVKPTAEVRFPPPPRSTRVQIRDAFAYDPSCCPEEVTWNMGQAMLLMNHAEIQVMINADPDSQTALSKLIKREDDDAIAVTKLYLRVLARQPKAPEMSIILEHIDHVGDRGAAFEDLLWSLVNSAEFHVRH